LKKKEKIYFSSYLGSEDYSSKIKLNLHEIKSRRQEIKYLIESIKRGIGIFSRVMINFELDIQSYREKIRQERASIKFHKKEADNL